MKKFFVILCALAVALMTASGVWAASVGERLRGSGRIITRTFDLPEFETIAAARGVDVFITKESSGKITVEADDNVMDKVVVRGSNGVLTLTIDKSVTSITRATVRIYLPATGRICAFKARSGASIRCETVLRAGEFRVDLSSGASVDLALKADSCKADLSSGASFCAALDVEACSVAVRSGSEAELSGKAATLSVDVTSGSSFQSLRLQAARCSVDATSGSNARVSCSEFLRARASSGADIVYAGDCRTEISRSSGGSVRKK